MYYNFLLVTSLLNLVKKMLNILGKLIFKCTYFCIFSMKYFVKSLYNCI